MSVSLVSPTYTPMLQGTLPVLPYDATQFFGTVLVDGQQPKVAALVADEKKVVLLHLIGPNVSVGAALATLFKGKPISYLPPPSAYWSGQKSLERHVEPYKQQSTHLDGTREGATLAISSMANIGEGVMNPLDLVPPLGEKSTEMEKASYPDKLAKDKVARRRYLLGNLHEETPHPLSFLGHLYAMRCVFLHRHPQHPEYVTRWADELWTSALRTSLVYPLPDCVGIRAWRLSGDLDGWQKLIGCGVRESWLPY